MFLLDRKYVRPVLSLIVWISVYFVYLIFTLFPSTGFAQNFDWVHQTGSETGTDIGRAVTTDATGNIYVTGNIDGLVDLDPGPGVHMADATGGTNAFIQKFDASGNLVWASNFGSESLTQPNTIKIAPDGSIYIAGSFANTADFDPGPGMYNLTATNSDAFLLKLNTSGNLIFAKKFGGPNYDYGKGMDIDASGNIYITGTFAGTFDADPGGATVMLNGKGSADIFFLKVNAFGFLVWAKSIGSTAYDQGNAIAADASGNVYVTGYVGDTTDLDPGSGIVTAITQVQDVFILKLNSSGSLTWAKSFGGSYWDEAVHIKIDNAGNVYTMGYFVFSADFDPGSSTFNLSSKGSNDVFVHKLNAAGTFEWAKVFGGTSNDVGIDFVLDDWDNIYITGMFSSTADFDPDTSEFNLSTYGGKDIFVLRLNNNGVFSWVKRFGGMWDDAGYGVIVSQDKIITVGHFKGSCDFDPGVGTYSLDAPTTFDAFVHKMSIEDIVSVTESNGWALNFVLYPNPVHETIYIDSQNIYEYDKPEFTIYSMQGQLILEKTLLQQQESISVGSIPNGVYNVSIRSGEIFTTKKLVVQHE